MTGEEFRAALQRVRWSARTLADLVQVRQTTAARWANGQQPIPEPVARWLTRVVRWIDANPPPTAPRREFRRDDNDDS